MRNNQCRVNSSAILGLRENPFGVTPDPRFLFLSQTHREALASLVNGIDCDFGFQILVAQPGMGKTTLLFNFLERFRGEAHTAFLFQPQPNPVELFQSVLIELGTHSEETSLRKLSEQLNQVLTRSAEEHKRVIVVLDEAQNLDFSVLEALRQLSNFETASSKLMQIILAGQPQLAKRLALPEQEQLMQRISAFGRLSPLALTETQAYIEHRLATAGYQGAHLFTQGAIRSIWERSRGVPRNVNTLCFGAMMLAFAEHAKSIDNRIIDEAGRDLDLNSVLADLYQTPSPRPTSQPKIIHDQGNEPFLRPAGASVSRAPYSARRHSDGRWSACFSRTIQQSKPSRRRRKTSGRTCVSSATVAPPAEEERRSRWWRNQLRWPKSRPAAPPLPVPARPQATKAAATGPGARNSWQGSAAPDFRNNSESSVGCNSKNKAANPAKNTPPKKGEEPVRPQREAARRQSSLNKQQLAEKRSESRIWWAKALALTAITGILAFVLGEQFLTHRPGQVEANGSGVSSLAQSSSGATNDGPISN